MQDRLTKAGLFAAAAIPEYWIINLPAVCVEVLRAPDPAAGRYAQSRVARRGDQLDMVALPGASIPVAALLPEDS